MVLFGKIVIAELIVQANEVLKAAQNMPPSAEKFVALKRAGILRNRAIIAHLLETAHH